VGFVLNTMPSVSKGGIKINKYIRPRKSQLHFFRNVPLFIRINDFKFVLYKPPGITLGEMRINEGRFPEELFVKQADKLKGVQEAQKAFNKHLEDSVKSGNPEKVKEILITMVEETLLEPRSGSLENFSDTVAVLVSDYSKEFDVIKQLLNISSTDYSIVLHSINVMAFALAFASFNNYSKYEAKTLGLCAL